MLSNGWTYITCIWNFTSFDKVISINFSQMIQKDQYNNISQPKIFVYNSACVGTYSVSGEKQQQMYQLWRYSNLYCLMQAYSQYLTQKQNIHELYILENHYS
ncbi:Hypothetical_protein [Hexamita inflata]|uniref:Hypothetical_protein n=1 Tax=Hexamita inflata TaxID=28002 RepID=A0AA86R0C1_9EUKA|nr:Hypothetical protein HINF_LOCUS50784 [Hexamita inflata]CAI9963141.1 Hypothetical protein HINF_LOCUS50786 [Hexamita inflata]